MTRRKKIFKDSSDVSKNQYAENELFSVVLVLIENKAVYFADCFYFRARIDLTCGWALLSICWEQRK